MELLCTKYTVVLLRLCQSERTIPNESESPLCPPFLLDCCEILTTAGKVTVRHLSTGGYAAFCSAPYLCTLSCCTWDELADRPEALLSLRRFSCSALSSAQCERSCPACQCLFLLRAFCYLQQSINKVSSSAAFAGLRGVVRGKDDLHRFASGMAPSRQA